MRNFIFQFEQEKLIDLDINLRQALLLDYLCNFFGSGFAKILTKQERYYWIAYDKIMEDLPLIYNNKRQITRDILELTQKQIIKKEKHNNKLYVCVDCNYLIFGKKSEYA